MQALCKIPIKRSYPSTFLIRWVVFYYGLIRWPYGGFEDYGGKGFKVGGKGGG